MFPSKIPTHDVPAFRQKFMRDAGNLPELLRLGFEQFFVVRVEEMFRQIRLPVPPMRAETTSVILLTSGEANMRIGGEAFRIIPNECLVVPSGQVFSFEKPDVNTGYLLHFHVDFLSGNMLSPERLRGFGFLQIWGNPVVRLEEQAAVFAGQIAERALHQYASHGLKNAELLQAHLFALLCELNCPENG